MTTKSKQRHQDRELGKLTFKSGVGQIIRVVKKTQTIREVNKDAGFVKICCDGQKASGLGRHPNEGGNEKEQVTARAAGVCSMRLAPTAAYSHAIDQPGDTTEIRSFMVLVFASIVMLRE